MMFRLDYIIKKWKQTFFSFAHFASLCKFELSVASYSADELNSDSCDTMLCTKTTTSASTETSRRNDSALNLRRIQECSVN